MKVPPNFNPASKAAMRRAKERMKAMDEGVSLPKKVRKHGRGFKPWKYTEEFCDKFADDLWEWLQEGKNFFVGKFCAIYEPFVELPQYLNALKNFPRAQLKYDRARTFAEYKFMEMGLLKLIDPGLCARMLPIMSSTFRAWRMIELELSSDGGEDKTINVTILPSKGALDMSPPATPEITIEPARSGVTTLDVQ